MPLSEEQRRILEKASAELQQALDNLDELTSFIEMKQAMEKMKNAPRNKRDDIS